MKDFIDSGRWRHYLPTIFIFLAAWFFIAIPGAAVLIVSGALIVVGVLYAWVVYRVHSIKGGGREQPPIFSWEQELWEQGEPTFRNVTATIIQKKN